MSRPSCLLPITRENGARGRKKTRALLCTLSTRVGCRPRSLLKRLLERGLLPRGRTTRLSSGLLLSPWRFRLPLGCAVGHPLTLLPAVLAASMRFRITGASIRPLSAAPYSSCFFLLGTAYSPDSTFRTRLNVAEIVGLLNSRPSLRRFSRDRVHEIRVLLPACPSCRGQSRA